MSETVIELTVRLPESLIEDLGGVRIASEKVTQAAVLDLVRIGRISVGRGSELLQMTRCDFLGLMEAHDLPVINYTPNDLTQELDSVRRLLEKTARP